MTRRREPGAQLPLLINPQASAPETDAEELQALLEALIEGLKQWDGPDAPRAADGGEGDDIRALMSESIAAFAALGIRVEYRAS